MTTTIEARPPLRGTRNMSRLAGPALILGGIAFFAGGVTHPSDSGEGSKVQQLHEMLVNPSWYPSHAFLLMAMGLFAAGILALRLRHDLTPGLGRLLRVVFVIACIATVSMAVHLFAALGAQSLADGQQSFVSRGQTVNETVVDATWGLAIAALALFGGLTGRVGNRITIPFGVAGGLAFALASATIAYTDKFGSLFKIGALISIWAIIVGVMTTRRSFLTHCGSHSIS